MTKSIGQRKKENGERRKNTTTNTRKTYKEGTRVLLRDLTSHKQKWKEAQVLKQLTDRSYSVVSDGQLLEAVKPLPSQALKLLSCQSCVIVLSRQNTILEREHMLGCSSVACLRIRGLHDWEDQHETRYPRWTLCLAMLCPVYGGCFSGGICLAFSPVPRHM